MKGIFEMDFSSKDIALKIKQLCKDKKIPIKSVLEECSLNRNFIYDLENRGSVPSIEAFYNLSNCLDCSVDYLLGIDPDMSMLIRDIKYSHCIIAYIDVLGTKNKLKENSDNYLDIIQTIARCIKGVVDKVNSDKTVSKELKYKIFSDNIVFALEYDNSNFLEHTQLMIQLISMFQYKMTEQNLFIRGSICTGDLNINNMFIVGKGLVKAYELESRNAVYPRVILDKELAEKIFANNIDFATDKNFALRVDSDNYSFLNYLNFASSSEDIKKHYDFFAKNAGESYGENERQKNDWVRLYHNSYCTENNYSGTIFKDINALTLGDNTNSNDTYDNHGTNNGIIGHAHAPVTIIGGRESKHSEQETALIDIFNRLDVVKQAKLLVLADELEKE